MPKFDSDNRLDNAEKRPVSGPTRRLIIAIQKFILWLSNHWLGMANLLAGVILGLGFLAPALMSLGLDQEAQTVYRFLASQNHQLPQRSYYLFGEVSGLQSYSLEQVLAAGADPQRLEAFIGSAELGFKMALNHRMVAIFIAIFFGGLVWGFRGRQPQIDAVLFLLFLLPLLIDGFSHAISEQTGAGFRETNAWARLLTGNLFPSSFYRGTTLGTLNWFLRTLTGLIFGLGLVWFLYGYLARRFAAVRRQLEPKLKKIGM